MTKTLLLLACAILSFGCNSAQPGGQNSSVAAPPSNERAQTAIAHNTVSKTPPPSADANGSGSRWKQSGEPIDTKDLDSAIAAAELAARKDPANAAAKKKLAAAYHDRAAALTDAKQYASALGDYRRALKNDPADAEAKVWIDKIIDIYDSMGRAYPKEGEEPPPLSKVNQ